MVDMIFLRQVCSCSNVLRSVVGDNFLNSTPSAQDLSEYEIADCGRVFFLEHVPFWICSQRASSVNNVVIAVGLRHEHSVHVDFPK